MSVRNEATQMYTSTPTLMQIRDDYDNDDDFDNDDDEDDNDDEYDDDQYEYQYEYGDDHDGISPCYVYLLPLESCCNLSYIRCLRVLPTSLAISVRYQLDVSQNAFRCQLDGYTSPIGHAFRLIIQQGSHDHDHDHH